MLVQNKDDVVYLIIYRASNKISWSKLRKIEIFGKKCKMCPEETVIKLGVKPGGVPPFAKIL
jgi:prolyl-tRNA editing enzyme YbaK/EbsC (Cys-tRNA(Pro) deacylase)